MVHREEWIRKKLTLPFFQSQMLVFAKAIVTRDRNGNI